MFEYTSSKLYFSTTPLTKVYEYVNKWKALDKFSNFRKIYFFYKSIYCIGRFEKWWKEKGNGISELSKMFEPTNILDRSK